MMGTNRARDTMKHGDALSKAEQRVYDLMTNTTMQAKEVARALDCGLGTIRNHMHAIFVKTGTKSRVELIHHAHSREEEAMTQ